VLGSPW